VTDVVVRGLVRETIETTVGELRVRGLVREAVVVPGEPDPEPTAPLQYAVTVIVS
jgi:hypothetical protein